MRKERKRVLLSYLPLIAVHVHQHVNKSLEARGLSCVAKLRLCVADYVLSAPLRNLLSAQHQL